MRCRKCKMNIPNGAKVCGYCGARQGISCGGLIGAFVFVIVALFIVNAAVNYGKGGSTTSSKPTTTQSSSTSVPTSSTKSDSSKPSTSSTKADTTTEPEMTQPETTKYPTMNGFVIGEKKGKSDEYGCRVVGVVANGTGKDCRYVQITIGFYSKNGAKIDSGIDNVLNLGAGESWQYEVYGLGSNISSFKIEDISWY